jgi:hypothetical protein
VVSIIFPRSLVIHAHRSTSGRTPANPAPTPFGASRRGSPTHLLEPLDVCTCLSATRRGCSRTKQCPIARSRATPAKRRHAPPRRSCLWHARRRASLTHVMGRVIYDGRTGSCSPSFYEAGPPWTRGPRPRRGPPLPQPPNLRSPAWIVSNPGSNLSTPVSRGDFD